jgi:hypothetical protein
MPMIHLGPERLRIVTSIQNFNGPKQGVLLREASKTQLNCIHTPFESAKKWTKYSLLYKR